MKEVPAKSDGVHGRVDRLRSIFVKIDFKMEEKKTKKYMSPATGNDNAVPLRDDDADDEGDGVGKVGRLHARCQIPEKSSQDFSAEKKGR